MRLTLLHVLLFACILSACAGKKKDKSSKKGKLLSMEKTLEELTERIDSIEEAIAAPAHSCMMFCLHGECAESDGSWKCACDDGYTGIHCESEIPEQFHDCFDIQSKGLGSANGVYEVTLPESGETERVYCDMETGGGGWTVFQRRISNDVDFYINMAGYKTGFGDNSGNVWLGLNALAQMTANNNSEMQISMTAADDTKMTVSYDYFQVGSAPEYALFVAGEERDPENDEISQWVKDVPKFSSQYNTNTWAASTVIGPPKVYPNYGDKQGTWAQSLGTGYTGQYIEMIFEERVIVTAIDIYETYHAGAVKKITSIVGSSESEVLFETEDIQNIGSARIFSPPLKPTTKPTDRIRIEVDNSVSRSWTEIDAVLLHGTRLTQTATAGLLDSVGSSFSTFDDDKSGNDCATLYHGGWWYNSACTKMNLNGAYETPGTESTQGGGLGGMIFEPFQQKKSLKETKMMFRRK